MLLLLFSNIHNVKHKAIHKKGGVLLCCCSVSSEGNPCLLITFSHQLRLAINESPVAGSSFFRQTFFLLSPIWTGGGGAKMAPMWVFAKYLKNGLANLYETL